jgi:hypothetical protein
MIDVSTIAERARQRHPALVVEQPPAPWTTAAGDDAVDALIDLLIDVVVERMSGASRSAAGLTLLVNNVVVEPDTSDDEGGGPPPGDYVALSLEGADADGALGDATWSVDAPNAFNDATLEARLRSAGAVYGYTRGAPRTSHTIFLRRGSGIAR